MKTQLWCLFCLSFVIQTAISQPDLQWLISNGKGKDGLTSGANINNYSASNVTTNTFALKEIALPSPSVSIARNDLFVIYSDYEHFNSRDINQGLEGFFQNPAPPATQRNHNFRTNYSGSVKYLYLTNRYEGDDPPLNVKVPSAHVPNQVIYEIGTTTSPILTADHEVVFNKDITVIINYDSLTNGQHDQNTDAIVLKYNGILPVGGSLQTDNSFLTLQPVFETAIPGALSAGLPIQNFSSSTPGEVTLLPGPGKYRYINFRPNIAGYNTYGPDRGGNLTHSAVFTIYKNGKALSPPLTEGIMYSHDPNFLRIDSICRAEDGSHVVFYHLQFENTSREVSVNHPKVQLRFPDYFDLNCLEAIKWFAGGQTCNGRIDRSDKYTTFEFLENNPLSVRNAQNNTNCMGFVDFRIKVNSGKELSDVNNSLLLLNIEVLFDNVSFPINEFHDLMYYDSEEWHRTISSGPCCYCMPIIPFWAIIASIIAFLCAVVVIIIVRQRNTPTPTPGPGPGPLNMNK